MNCKQVNATEKWKCCESGFVRRGELYTLQTLKVRLGLKDAALRSARRAGLAVRYFGGRGYVLGDDVIAFVTNAKSSSSE